MSRLSRRAYAGHGLSSQPDWVAYEDCTMLRVDSGHSTAHWHDIPCSLGKHSLGTLNRAAAAEALAGWRQMEELPITTISAYICKMSSHKAGERRSSALVTPIRASKV